MLYSGGKRKAAARPQEGARRGVLRKKENRDRGLLAAGEERGQEVEEILRVELGVVVEVGPGGEGEEGVEEVEEVLGVQRAVVVEVGGAVGNGIENLVADVGDVRARLLRGAEAVAAGGESRLVDRISRELDG